MADAANLDRLSEQTIASMSRALDEQGYFVLPQVVCREDLADFNMKILEAYGRTPRFRGGGTVMGHLNCYPGESARFIYRQLQDKGVVDAVLSACPDLPHRLRATLNFNLPGSRTQHYHMDGVYTDDYVICNVAVVDTDVENGAIDVLPGTHREFYPFWRYALERKYRLSTRLPLAAGDVLLRRSTLWHRGMPNRSPLSRPMFSLAIGESYVPEGDPFAGGADLEFYPNWYGTGRGGELRERLESAVPMSRSLARFAKSLAGNRGYDAY